jgi:hypothetical protein
MMLSPRLVALAAVVALAGALSPNCSCSSFCNGTCAATNNGKPIKLAVYRLTPYNVTDIAEKDTGDAAGDMGFYLEKFRAQMTCTPDEANTDSCFLGFKPVVRRFMLEMDGKWGPFFRCNPMPFANNPDDGVHVDTKHWGCYPWHGRAPTPWVPPQPGPGSSGRGSSCLDNAYCPEIMNASVGRDPAQHHAYTPGSRDLGTFFGGEWYSTTSQGQCPPNRAPGDGLKPTCSWRVSPGAATKTINATCMDSHLLPLIESNGKACFATLPKPLNRSSYQYVDCLEAAVTGCGTAAAGGIRCPGAPDLAPAADERVHASAPPPPPMAIEPIDRARMVAAWNQAFMEPAEGGCPNLP